MGHEAMKLSFSPHEVEWTPDKLRRFWDFTANNMGDLYFAKMVGHSVVAYAARHIRIGTSLDLGCGEGDLIVHLLKHGRCFGADQSPASVAAVNVRFAGHRNFAGAAVGTEGLPLVDTIFMLEVVEHLDDNVLNDAIAKARSLLKPGGSIVITTPNDEDLSLSRRMCPDCGCVFHQMQHVRSWSAATLSERMSQLGFHTLQCKPTLFSPHHAAGAVIDRLRYWLLQRKMPNLVYIGT